MARIFGKSGASGGPSPFFKLTNNVEWAEGAADGQSRFRLQDLSGEVLSLDLNPSAASPLALDDENGDRVFWVKSNGFGAASSVLQGLAPGIGLSLASLPPLPIDNADYNFANDDTGAGLAVYALPDGRVFVYGISYWPGDGSNPTQYAIFNQNTRQWTLHNRPMWPIEAGWEPVSVGRHRDFQHAQLADGRVLIMGGRLAHWGGPSEWNQAYWSYGIFDPTDDSWELYDESTTIDGLVLPTAESGRGFVRLADGRVALSGDVDLKYWSANSQSWEYVEPVNYPWLIVYDPATNRWTSHQAADSLGIYEPGGYGSVVQLQDGRVMVAGGWNQGEFPIWDPGSNTWIVSGAGTGTSLPSDAYWMYASAGVLSDGRVVIAGGELNNRPNPRTYNASRIYTPSTDTWVDGPTLTQERVYPVSIVDGMTFVVIGGLDGNWNGAGVIDTYEAFDGNTNTFAAGAEPLLGPAFLGGITPYQGGYLFVGSLNENWDLVSTAFRILGVSTGLVPVSRLDFSNGNFTFRASGSPSTLFDVVVPTIPADQYVFRIRSGDETVIPFAVFGTGTIEGRAPSSGVFLYAQLSVPWRQGDVGTTATLFEVGGLDNAYSPYVSPILRVNALRRTTDQFVVALTGTGPYYNAAEAPGFEFGSQGNHHLASTLFHIYGWDNGSDAARFVLGGRPGLTGGPWFDTRIERRNWPYRDVRLTWALHYNSEAESLVHPFFEVIEGHWNEAAAETRQIYVYANAFRLSPVPEGQYDQAELALTNRAGLVSGTFATWESGVFAGLRLNLSGGGYGAAVDFHSRGFLGLAFVSACDLSELPYSGLWLDSSTNLALRVGDEVTTPRDLAERSYKTVVRLVNGEATLTVNDWSADMQFDLQTVLPYTAQEQANVGIVSAHLVVDPTAWILNPNYGFRFDYSQAMTSREMPWGAIAVIRSGSEQTHIATFSQRHFSLNQVPNGGQVSNPLSSLFRVALFSYQYRNGGGVSTELRDLIPEFGIVPMSPVDRFKRERALLFGVADGQPLCLIVNRTDGVMRTMTPYNVSGFPTDTSLYRPSCASQMREGRTYIVIFGSETSSELRYIYEGYSTTGIHQISFLTTGAQLNGRHTSYLTRPVLCGDAFYLLGDALGNERNFERVGLIDAGPQAPELLDPLPDLSTLLGTAYNYGSYYACLGDRTTPNRLWYVFSPAQAGNPHVLIYYDVGVGWGAPIAVPYLSDEAGLFDVPFRNGLFTGMNKLPCARFVLNGDVHIWCDRYAAISEYSYFSSKAWLFNTRTQQFTTHNVDTCQGPMSGLSDAAAMGCHSSTFTARRPNASILVKSTNPLDTSEVQVRLTY